MFRKSHFAAEDDLWVGFLGMAGCIAGFPDIHYIVGYLDIQGCNLGLLDCKEMAEDNLDFDFDSQPQFAGLQQAFDFVFF